MIGELFGHSKTGLRSVVDNIVRKKQSEGTHLEIQNVLTVEHIIEVYASPFSFEIIRSIKRCKLPVFLHQFKTKESLFLGYETTL